MAASDDFHVEIKRIRKEDNIETIQKLEFCDVDELVHNPGLQHVALYIFNLMDFYTLKTCRAISKSWKRMIDNDNSINVNNSINVIIGNNLELLLVNYCPDYCLCHVV